MRMRRKPWARPELEGSNMFLVKPPEYKGKWSGLFNNNNPIYLELGCGKGTFVAVHAAENPDKNYIAIDIKDEVLVLAKRHIEKAFEENNRKEIDNVKIMSQEIGLIENVFEENEISHIYINFCNPWTKKRHKKRRLTHTSSLKKYREYLKSGGEIWFKTDDDELFRDSQEYFTQSGFVITYITYDLHKSGFKGNVSTEHEDMFTKEGISTKFLIAKSTK